MDLNLTGDSIASRPGMAANGYAAVNGGDLGGAMHSRLALAGLQGRPNGMARAMPVEEWLRDVIEDFRDDAVICQDQNRRRLVIPHSHPQGHAVAARERGEDGLHYIGLLPGLYPEWLGSQHLSAECGSRFAYVVGEMARGIASVEMVIAAVKSGFIGFYGSAGLRVDTVRPALREIRQAVGSDAAWGANLIHSPERPEQEAAMVDLFLEEGVSNVSASAFMALSRDIVRFSAVGLRRGASGGIERHTRVFAKISRPEVAAPFMAPPPADMLAALVAAGAISEDQAAMQARLPVAEYFTVEGDSGGHTDGRPLVSLFPVIAALRDTMAARHDYARPLYLGAAGGIGTPLSAASAFAMGADYIVTGSVNQSAVESGLSEDGRKLLCQAGIADMAIAPAADMFEIGAKVQVLKRGTLFAPKAQRLQELYRRHTSVDEFSAKDRQWLETQVLKESFDQAWQGTRDYHAPRKPALVAAAEADPHVKMAMVFKRYLFMGSQWARDGHLDRRMDYQIWCGPAMGAFNDWAAGSFLESAEARTVEQIGLNLLEGAAQIARAQQLRSMGVGVPAQAFTPRPARLELG